MKLRIGAVLLAALLMVALPFLFRPKSATLRWSEGDPVLVVISPHNEAIRQEFGTAFSAWHLARYGVPVRVDWRSVGGTTEIMRYLQSEYIGSMRAWWERSGGDWPAAGGAWITAQRFDHLTPPDAPADRAAWEAQRRLWLAFRTNDSPRCATAHIDLFFGGGVFDHERAERQGLTVPPWRDTNAIPAGLFSEGAGRQLIPDGNSGEQWCGAAFFGTVLSTFGICYNPDRLHDLGLEQSPTSWHDLTDPRYFGQIGITDPTKSGSVAKAFEMIIQQACRERLQAAGISESEIAAREQAIIAAKLPPGELPDGVPADYQQLLEEGWREGINRVRLISANARYFTDGAGKVPIDVAMGAAAAGIAIDFFGRFQAEYTRAPDGTPRLVYITPAGGSSVSADPISLLRGAPQRELALRFIDFALDVAGQKLWNYRPGTPGGPRRYALRRLPIRRDFYPCDDPEWQARAEAHRAYTSDDLTDPAIDPYHLARNFTYQPRWTARHFGIQRDLVKALCLDSGDELRAAWREINAHGGAAQQPAALELLLRLPSTPQPVTWRTAIGDYYSSASRIDYIARWTAEMRANYRAARLAVIPLATTPQEPKSDG